MVNEVMTLAEATKLWKLADGTLRHCIRRGIFTEGTDYRKSEGTLLITRAAMEKRYGEIDEE